MEKKEDKLGYTIIIRVGSKYYIKRHCSNDELYKLQQQGYNMEVLDEITGEFESFIDQD